MPKKLFKHRKKKSSNLYLHFQVVSLVPFIIYV